ncbi:MAG: hypothetical protein IPL79_02580 [Myxococcales bacterium]|nr:hypothetical protein [Myxococcales bacterium]
MRIFTLVVALAACLYATPAAAQAQPTRLVVGGDPSSAVTVKGTALRWLAARGSVVDEAASKRDASAIAECMVQTSAAQCKGTIASDLPLWFLSVEADIADRSTNVVIVARLFDAAGALIASERQGCERCNVDSLRRATDDVLGALQRAADAQAPGAAAPPTAMPGDAAIIASSLRSTSARRPPAWAWGVTIGGGAAIATGVVLIALHKEPGTLPLKRVDTDLRTPGLVLGGIGIAAASVGIWRLLTPRRAGEATQPKRNAIAPFVDWSAGRATAGIVGVFR